jgi:hypothetical protein
MPDIVTKIIVPDNIIPQTISFFQRQGQKGFEGRVYWVGCLNGTTARIIRVVVPEQIPKRTFWGVSVTVPQRANVKVSRELKPGEYIVAKVHSHPGRAYNSETDKANPFLRHSGAISIIVPNFGRNGMDQLCNCVVCRFENNYWRELSKMEIRSLFQFG